MDLIALHLTFVPRINQALREFMETFNHHQLRTACHWSPYQMWVNGMLNDANPLAHGQLDNDPNNLKYYGIDPDNNNSELYLHDYNNTALQKRRKHHNYNNLTIRVQFQL